MFTHQVTTGETLQNIADRYETTEEELLRYNEIPNPSHLSEGLIIIIPLPPLPPTVPSLIPIRNINSRIVDGFLFSLAVNRFLYRRNQPVGMALIKTNVTRTPITLHYPTTQRFDFIVRRGISGPIVWRWSEGRVFAPVLETVVIPPEQSQVFRVRWNQTSNADIPVGTGVYTVIGQNMAREFRGETIAVRIRII